jgi:hypothetical protein
MMIKKWFKKKFTEWCKEAWYSEQEKEKHVLVGMGQTIEAHSIHSNPVLNFTIYNAIGGKIVEFRYHDRKSDRSHTQMYIIGKDDDFGERIAKIATLEVIKQ